jgi:hypothetical protein
MIPAKRVMAGRPMPTKAVAINAPGSRRPAASRSPTESKKRSKWKWAVLAAILLFLCVGAYAMFRGPSREGLLANFAKFRIPSAMRDDGSLKHEITTGPRNSSLCRSKIGIRSWTRSSIKWLSARSNGRIGPRIKAGTVVHPAEMATAMVASEAAEGVALTPIRRTLVEIAIYRQCRRIREHRGLLCVSL